MNNSKAILDANGGLHSKRALKKVQDRLQNHGLKRAILVHMVLTGSQSVKIYRDTYNDIADHIRDNGSRCEYFGCLEMDEVKGLHAHVYFVIETSKKFPRATLDVNDGAWLHRLADRRGLNRIHIAQPQNKMHYAKGKPQFFARLTEEAKLADCVERIEYLYKNRSKEGVPSREIYFNSNFEANKGKRTRKKPAPVLPAASPAAKEESISLNGEKVIFAKTGRNPAAPEATPKGNAMLTPTETYIASRYEEAVDQQLDLEAVRLFLLSQGIKRTPAQVAYELEEVFCFPGYASRNPAPAKDDVAAFDAAIDRAPARSARSVLLSPVDSRQAEMATTNQLTCYTTVQTYSR